MVTSGGTEKDHDTLRKKKNKKKKERNVRVGRDVFRLSINFNPEGCMFSTVFTRAFHWSLS
jgi:hypothetical protein